MSSLKTLTLPQLKVLVKQNLSEEEFNKLRLPRTKALLIKYIEENNIGQNSENVDNANIIKVAKNEKVVAKKVGGLKRQHQKEEKEIDSNNSSSEVEDVKHSESITTKTKKEIVVEEVSDEENDQPITVVTKSAGKKKGSSKKSTTSKPSSSTPSAPTRESLENMTVVLLKSTYFKGVAPSKVPKTKAVIIDAILEMFPSQDKVEEEEEEEEETIEKEEEEEDQVIAPSNNVDHLEVDMSDSTEEKEEEEPKQDEMVLEQQQPTVVDMMEDIIKSPVYKKKKPSIEISIKEDQQLVESLHKIDLNPSVFNEEIELRILDLVLHRHSREGVDKKYIIFSHWMVPLALVCKRWFEHVSTIVNHLECKPNLSIQVMRSLVAGTTHPFSILKHVKSVGFESITDKKMFLDIVHLGDEDDDDDEDYQDDEEHEEEEEEDDDYTLSSQSSVDEADLEGLDHSDDEDDESVDFEEEYESELLNYNTRHNINKENFVMEDAFQFTKYYMTRNMGHLKVSPVESIKVTNIPADTLSKVLLTRKFSNVQELAYTGTDACKYTSMTNIILGCTNIKKYHLTLQYDNVSDCDDDCSHVLIHSLGHQQLHTIKIDLDHGMLISNQVAKLFNSTTLKELSIKNSYKNPWYNMNNADQIQASIEKLCNAIESNTSITKLSLLQFGGQYHSDATSLFLPILTKRFGQLLSNNKVINNLSISSEYIDSTFFDSLINGSNQSIQSLKITGQISIELCQSILKMVSSNPKSLKYLSFNFPPTVDDNLCKMIESAFTNNSNIRYLEVDGGKMPYFEALVRGLRTSDSLVSLCHHRYNAESLVVLPAVQPYFENSKSLVYINNLSRYTMSVVPILKSTSSSAPIYIPPSTPSKVIFKNH